MIRGVVVFLTVVLACARLSAQDVQQVPEKSSADSTIQPISDTTGVSGQAPDSISVMAPAMAPLNYGTITEIKDLNQYNPQEVLNELKKGSFGHPVDIKRTP
jgi:hypothetical protein